MSHPDMHEQHLLFALAPIFAMAGGRDLIAGQFGTLILGEYTNAIGGFPIEVARQGVLNACAGETFKPSVERVRNACQTLLENLAQAALNESARDALNAMDAETKATIDAAPQADQNELRQRQWAKHFGISWESYLAVKYGSVLDKARLLPSWRKIEPDLGKEKDPIRALVDRMFGGGKARIENQETEQQRNQSSR